LDDISTFENASPDGKVILVLLMLDQPQELKLLIISNEPLIRAGLSSLLELEPGLRVSSQASAEADLDTMILVFQPDLILWDLGWEQSPDDGSGLQNELGQISDLATEGAAIIVLLSAPELARDAWVAGARAILLRDADRSSLGAAISAAANEMVVLEDSIAAHLLPELGFSEHKTSEELTPRELQVLQQLAEGLPNKIIARNLDVSEHTVKFHTSSIFRKLGVRSRTEAVVRGSHLGLILL
jgi:DNA-binding NarL/FixJ family response regulator